MEFEPSGLEQYTIKIFFAIFKNFNWNGLDLVSFLTYSNKKIILFLKMNFLNNLLYLNNNLIFIKS